MKKPDVEIRVALSCDLAADLKITAKEYDLTEGAIVREALTRFLNEAKSVIGANALSGGGYEKIENHKELVLYAVSEIVNESKSWADLQKRLQQENLEIVPKGGGLVVRSFDKKKELCKPSEASFGYSSLIKKFGSGFPGHSHKWLADRVLGEEKKID
jgi:hypothetical protein